MFVRKFQILFVANGKMLDLHKAHAGCDHVLGDVGCPQVMAELWRCSDHAAVMSAGYSCQPFSQLGDRKGGGDVRALTLPKVLRTALWMQIRVLILECVTPARSDPYVQQVLDKFVKLSGFRKEDGPTCPACLFFFLDKATPLPALGLHTPQDPRDCLLSRSAAQRI